MRIGFIGLGNMGAPMAHNLAKAGFEVVGFDTQDVKVDLIKIVSTSKECVSNSDVVITMLPNGEILKSVANKIIQHMRHGSIFLDCSTVDVESAKSVAEISENYGIIPLDAPVSGGIGGAEAGTLTFYGRRSRWKDLIKLKNYLILWVKKLFTVEILEMDNLQNM